MFFCYIIAPLSHPLNRTSLCFWIIEEPCLELGELASRDGGSIWHSEREGGEGAEDWLASVSLFWPRWNYENKLCSLFSYLEQNFQWDELEGRQKGDLCSSKRGRSLWANDVPVQLLSSTRNISCFWPWQISLFLGLSNTDICCGEQQCSFPIRVPMKMFCWCVCCSILYIQKVGCWYADALPNAPIL